MKEIIDKSPTIDYLAEFFNDTIDKLVAIMGPSDEDIKALETVENNLESVTKLKSKVKFFGQQKSNMKEKNIDINLKIHPPMDLIKLGEALEKIYDYNLNDIQSISLSHGRYLKYDDKSKLYMFFP